MLITLDFAKSMYMLETVRSDDCDYVQTDTTMAMTEYGKAAEADIV